ncbi:Rib/alpha-like domain-containing protein [Gardnerella sp. DNF01144]|uniref:Rib/alpha-like domain-containing protein n=1 Tax=Gardnerella sp. DNF01144 TaxID=2749058 RepID=UPI003BA884A1
MLPAGLRGFASRVGRLALRAFAWNKGGAESCAATSATAARTTRSARTLLRALLAMLITAATLLAMLVLPPVNKAKGFAEDRNSNPYPQVWWDGMGSGYVVGKGVTHNEGGKTYHPAWNAYNSISLPNAYIDRANRKIVWSVLIMKDNELYKSLKYNRPIDGNKQGPGRAAIMAFLPKGIDLDSVRIYRRRTGKTNPRILENNLTITKEDGSQRTYKRGTFISYGCFAKNNEWDKQNFGSYVKQNAFTVYPGNENCGQLDPKIHVGETISSFTGGRWNTNQASTNESDVAKYFDEAVGSMRLGDCNDEDNNGTGMCTVRQWKSNFAASLMDWEDRNLRGYEWHITATYNENVKHPELLPFLVGYSPNKTVGTWGDDNGKWAFMGPLDYDGDGIPDKVEYDMGTNPVEKTSLLYPKYDNKMLPDYIKKLKNDNGKSAYGGISNVPVTVFGTNAVLKPYVETGEWVGASGTGSFTKHKDETTSDLHLDDLPGTSMEETLNDENKVKYTLSDVPKGIKRNDHGECNVGTDHGCVNINYQTGVITYNPRKEDIGNIVTFTLSVRHPNGNIFPYKCAKNNKDGAWTEKQDVKIKVVSQASIYNPHYDETVVHNIKQGNGYYTVGTATSAEPKSVSNGKNWIMDGPLPKGTKFELKDYDSKKYPYAPKKLKWSSISKDNTNNGKVTFTPDKSNAGESNSTPVLVTYPDGSTSRDPDAGNNGSIVAAPVRVEDLTVTSNPQDLNLRLYDGKQINNSNQFYVLSFGNSSKPKELTKGQKIGKDAKDNGIVLDSWSTNAKGPITFRAVCHKKDDPKAPYTLLKPAEGKNKASGDVDGLQFQDFRQWIRDNDPKCANGNCTDGNQYLSRGEWNSSTMERSRALIGGTPEKAGEYECKVFAFHEPHTGAGKQYNGALKTFDDAAKNGGSTEYSILFNNYESIKAETKGTEWTVDSFHFKIKLNDNQKYNPTYVKTGTIEAGKFKIGDFVDSNGNSSKQPTSIKNGNGVPTKDQDDIVVDRLPKGTWFEIKRLIKSADKDNNKAKTYPWANLEGDEDNVKRDDKGNPVKKDNKIQPNDTTSIREYGAVTFRPDKWQDAGEYWAEVVVHYPDGTSTDQPESINYNHPVYAKVKVTRDDDNNKLRLDLYKRYSNIGMGNGYDLKVGESLPNDATFDSWMTKSVGNLHQHVVCSKKGKDGKYSDYTYNTLPGHVNNTKSNKDSEKDGLRFKSEKVWKHASFKQQEQCRLKGGSSCDKDNYLYDRDGASEQTRGSFGGKAQKTGDYECKVYVIRGDDKSAAFEKAVKKNIENNKKNKKNADPVDGVLKTKDNKYPYGTDGQGYTTRSFAIRIHNLNHFYNPQYNTITLTAGTHGSSAVPKSAKSANGATDNQSDVKAGDLPAGTWFERKRYKSENQGIPLLSYSLFENGQANTEDKKNAKDTKKVGEFGKVSFYPHKWMNATPEGKPDKVPVVVHYPDGSTSDDPDSGNNGKPIYAYVNIVRPKINNPDLKLELFSRYNDATDNTDGQKIAASYDSNNNINSQYGVTVMKNLGLIKDLGINAWSENKPGQIGFKLLCRKKGDSNSKWNEKLDKLFFHVSKEKKWGHADSFDKQKPCRENSSNCKADLLYDKDSNTMERSRGKIAGVPTEVGEYQCAVLAVKPDAEKVYTSKLAQPKNRNVGGDSSLNVENPANDFGKLVKNVDWAIVYFPVHVVEPFNLPKTGGEDCVNWNMLMSVVCVLGTGAMAAGFFLDQTKWGRAIWRAVAARVGLCGAAAGACGSAGDSTARAACVAECGASRAAVANRAVGAAACGHAEPAPAVKSFIRKTAKKLRALRRRSERWRC